LFAVDEVVLGVVAGVLEVALTVIVGLLRY
jgi:hypothetical protein